MAPHIDPAHWIVPVFGVALAAALLIYATSWESGEEMAAAKEIVSSAKPLDESKGGETDCLNEEPI